MAHILVQVGEIELPIFTGEDHHAAALAKMATSGWLDGELKALPLSSFVGLAWLLRGGSNFYLFSKSVWDTTPLGQRTQCVLQGVNSLWTSVRLGHFQY